MFKADSPCVFCREEGGTVLLSHDKYRVVWANEPLYPGFLRLIWKSHVKEFTDLSAEDRRLCMDMVGKLEELVRMHMSPDKVNVASLGNVTPHLHWHVIPRFKDDAHFPDPVWGNPRRDVSILPCIGQQAIATNKAELQVSIQQALKAL